VTVSIKKVFCETVPKYLWYSGARLPIYFFPTTTTEDTDENITFNASGTYDVEGDNVSYYWDFGDDTNGTGAIVIHSYAETGSYWVELTVSDGELESTEQIHVMVKQQGG